MKIDRSILEKTKLEEKKHNTLPYLDNSDYSSMDDFFTNFYEPKVSKWDPIQKWLTEHSYHKDSLGYYNDKLTMSKKVSNDYFDAKIIAYSETIDEYPNKIKVDFTYFKFLDFDKKSNIDKINKMKEKIISEAQIELDSLKV